MFQKHLKKESKIFFFPYGILTFWKHLFPNTLATIYYKPLCCRMTLLVEVPIRQNWQIKENLSMFSLSIRIRIFFLPPNVISRQSQKWSDLFINRVMVSIRPSRHQTIQEAEGTWKRKESLWAGTPACLYHTMPSLMSCWLKVLVGVAVLPSGRCCPSSAGLSAGILTRRTTSPRKTTELVRTLGKAKVNQSSRLLSNHLCLDTYNAAWQ